MVHWSTISFLLFHCSTITCSAVPPWDVLLYHHQMFHCSTISVPLFHHNCFTVLPSDVPLFHYLCSIVPPSRSPAPPSDVPLFHDQMFHCSTIRCSTVPPSDVLRFHHQMFYFSTIRCSIVPPWDVPVFHDLFSSILPSLFDRSTIRSSTVPLLHHDCLTVPLWLFNCSSIR